MILSTTPRRAPLAAIAALVLALPAASVVHAPALAQAQPPVTHVPSSVADLAEGLLDAVVNISTSQAAPAGRGGRGGQRPVPRPGLPERSP
jgi:serine protease Do